LMPGREPRCSGPSVFSNSRYCSVREACGSLRMRLKSPGLWALGVRRGSAGGLAALRAPDRSVCSGGRHRRRVNRIGRS
jgi:hypothetical protein